MRLFALSTSTFALILLGACADQPSTTVSAPAAAPAAGPTMDLSGLNGDYVRRSGQTMSAVRICGGEVVGYAFIPNVGNPDRQFRYAHLSTSADGSMRFQGRPGEVLTVTASDITPTGFQGTVIAPNGNRFSGPFRFKDADQC